MKPFQCCVNHLERSTITNLCTLTNLARMVCVRAFRVITHYLNVVHLELFTKLKDKTCFIIRQVFFEKKSPFFLDMDFHCQIERLT